MEMTILFNDTNFYGFSQALFEEAKKAISNISNKDFEKRSENQLFDEVFKEYKLDMPVLDESKISQKEPEDVGNNNTKFEFVIPIKRGTKTLLTVCPTNHSTARPEGNPKSESLNCVYTKTSNTTTTDDINTEFRNNLQVLNKYLKWLNEDVNEHNKNLKSLISTIIQQRKQKAQRDKDDAQSLGFPVK
jgi:hypothetical protein